MFSARSPKVDRILHHVKSVPAPNELGRMDNGTGGIHLRIDLGTARSRFPFFCPRRGDCSHEPSSDFSQAEVKLEQVGPYDRVSLERKNALCSDVPPSTLVSSTG